MPTGNPAEDIELAGTRLLCRFQGLEPLAEDDREAIIEVIDRHGRQTSDEADGRWTQQLKEVEMNSYKQSVEHAVIINIQLAGDHFEDASERITIETSNRKSGGQLQTYPLQKLMVTNLVRANVLFFSMAAMQMSFLRRSVRRSTSGLCLEVVA